MSFRPNPPQSQTPINPLPVIVWVLALPLIAFEVVFALGSSGLVGGPMAIGWRLEAIQWFAFSPELLRYMAQTGDWTFGGVARTLTYPLVHGTFSHALFVIVILLALGKMVGEIFRWWAVLVIVLGAAIVGALVYTLALPWNTAPLIGGYPPVYGLIGAFSFILWVRLSGRGGNQLQAFSLIGFLMGFQLLFGVLFGGTWEWVAELAGFATGFLLSFLVSPGGFARVRARLRQR